ncbi:hypothetical protein FNV43_RR25698 [Rhamnella rubrinervis]|uniref:Uncharacterized protein n=1 Tax=Rhamnella rubrinervis TaxID=2594499 RepID=A0A8K0DMY4_9ROSA|nr:hypothetical protein FNV43_RR25698 [Rhamnella rubrinervis]
MTHCTERDQSIRGGYISDPDESTCFNCRAMDDHDMENVLHFQKIDPYMIAKVSYMHATDFNGVEVVRNHLSRTGHDEWARQAIITIYNCLSSVEVFEEPEHKKNQPGKSLGVIGLGCLACLGINDYLSCMQSLAKSFDFIIDTASGDHPFDPYTALLKTAGILVLVGFPREDKFSPANLNPGQHQLLTISVTVFIELVADMGTISGIVTGGMRETQEMVAFSAARDVHPTIDMIPIQYANEALERLAKRGVKYWFVIDIENSLE